MVYRCRGCPAGRWNRGLACGILGLYGLDEGYARMQELEHLSFPHVHGSTSRLNLERGCNLSTMRVKWMPALLQIVMLFFLELDCHKMMRSNCKIT